MSNTRSIYLSYADEDEALASQLNSALDKLLEGQSFFRRFDLRAGASLYEVIDDAVSSAKWFILILSSKSINSNWIKIDAKLQTIRWLQQINCNIIVVKIDDFDIPKHLRIALESQYLINLYESQDIQDEFIEIANYILKNTSCELRQDLFVDRGDAEDRFAYISRHHRVVFVLGMGGIGKTAFILNKVSHQLGKQPIRVKLMAGMGNSIDYIARQVLKETFVEQPVDNVDEQTLARLASEAIKKRSRRYFLFVDNLEYSLNVSNELDEKFIDFLLKLIEDDLRTHIVLATTRTPQYPVDFASHCDILRLDELEDLYIHQCIDEWLKDHPHRQDIMKSPSMPSLIKAAGGLPLAAQLLVSSLKSGISPERIVSSDEPKRIKLRLAAKILGTLQSVLTDVEKTILQIVAFYNEAISIDDLLELNSISRFGKEKVENAILNLSKYLLIKEGENGYLTLHTFLALYYRDQLSREGGDNTKQSVVANEIADFTLRKTKELHHKLLSVVENVETDDKATLKFQLTSEILRYAVPANKFLRITNRYGDAERLPIQIKGVARDLVLYFYRDAKDYNNTIRYADTWLKIFPKDYEILLYKARALRNLGQENHLKEAEEILGKIDDVTHSRFFNDRVDNERGKIATQKGNDDLARSIYANSIKNATTYPETYVNLARLYLRDSRSLPDNRFDEKQALAKDAIKLLEKANSVSRSASDIFEQFFFDVYIEALELIEDDSAYYLLEDALEEKPNDRRLNFRMAEILRERGKLDEAEHFACVAIKHDSISAYISLANIYCAKGRLLMEDNNIPLANTKFAEAKKYAGIYKARSPYSQYGVADSILARIHRLSGDWIEAERILEPHQKSLDRYIAYEYAEVLLYKANQKIHLCLYKEALDMLNEADFRLNQVNAKSQDHMLLKEKINRLIDSCRTLLRGE